MTHEQTLRSSGRVAIVVTAVLLACWPGSSAWADVITLKGSVRLAAGAEVVRLSDIATLTGPLAEQHADLVVAAVSRDDDVLELDVARVRRMLDEAGVHWGKVNLNGRKVIVRAATPAATLPALAMQAISIDGVRREHAARLQVGSAGELVDLPTLRGRVAQTMVAGLGVDPEMLRLVFNERDEAFLDTPLEAFRFEIQPLANFNSDRVELRVRAWVGYRIDHHRSVTVHPKIRTTVYVLRHELARGAKIQENDLVAEERWLSVRQADAMSTLVEAAGRPTVGKLHAGASLRMRDLQREIIIERGDRVMVRCLVGGIVITMEAEARSDAAEGEQVELRKAGERETFFGIAAAAGSVIVDLTR